METLYTYQGISPQVDEDAFIAPGAKIIGKVVLKKGANIWFNTVLRGDTDYITIGEDSNIQDNSTIHTDPGDHVIIGNCVTVGHNTVLHGCVIEDCCLIGMHATILNEARIGRGSVIGAGAIITKGTVIPPFSLVVGAPGKVIRTLDEGMLEERKKMAIKYAERGRQYKAEI